MVSRRALDVLGREPLYNTRAVVQLTDVPADTFRAWERRYGLPRPHRTPGNQRLYSERDIGVIAWLRDRTNEGMTISQAIQRLRLEHPEVFETQQARPPTATAAPEPGAQLARLRERLIAAIVAFDSVAGERAIDEALGLLTLEQACERVILPTMVEIGERWARNEVSVAAEHFASRLVLRRLSAIFNLVAPVAGRGTIVAACPPGEEHEIGLLVLSIFLARRSWRMIYLGANVPARDLAETARQVEPDLICLSAAMAPSAERALQLAHDMRCLDHPPAIVCGGRAFDQRPALQLNSGAHYVGGELHDAAHRIGEIIEQRARAARSSLPRA